MEPSGRVTRTKRPELWIYLSLIVCAVAIFYWVPLTSVIASIQWDAADLHYPTQKYFSDQVRAGNWPVWTPYIYSGYPFLAYPETGAWYPLNWPFMLVGITPRAIQLEIALHALLAVAGAFLLFSRLLPSRTGALAGAFAYGLSGFFAGHSSHLGIFSVAALLPWALLGLRLSIEESSLRFVSLSGIATGFMILAGHMQAAMYAFLAVVLYGCTELALGRRHWLRIAGAIVLTLAIAVGIGAITLLPAFELAKASTRAASDFSQSTEGVLEPRSLATLVAPNALGAVQGEYSGPSDITQHYLYAGLLLLPLAIAGVTAGRTRFIALALAVPAIWYMLGPGAGLYRIGAFIPYLQKVRAPVHGWFVAALGLSLLAAEGVAWISRRVRWRYAAPLLAVMLFADVWYWNSWTNRLAYARANFEQLYGGPEAFFATQIGPRLSPSTRFEAPERLAVFGPLNHPLLANVETTYGYLALELREYKEYVAAIPGNPKLRDGLNVSAVLDLAQRGVRANESILPRVYAPRAVRSVSSLEESRSRLSMLDPAAEAIVVHPNVSIQQDPSASASIISRAPGSYRIGYRAATPSLLRVSVPFYPGWRATVTGREIPIVRTDHAFMGVIVNPGEGEIDLRFGSNYLGLGAAVSGLTFALAVGLAFVKSRIRATSQHVMEESQMASPLLTP